MLPNAGGWQWQLTQAPSTGRRMRGTRPLGAIHRFIAPGRSQVGRAAGHRRTARDVRGTRRVPPPSSKKCWGWIALVALREADGSSTRLSGAAPSSAIRNRRSLLRTFASGLALPLSMWDRLFCLSSSSLRLSSLGLSDTNAYSCKYDPASELLFGPPGLVSAKISRVCTAHSECQLGKIWLANLSKVTLGAVESRQLRKVSQPPCRLEGAAAGTQVDRDVEVSSMPRAVPPIANPPSSSKSGVEFDQWSQPRPSQLRTPRSSSKPTLPPSVDKSGGWGIMKL